METFKNDTLENLTDVELFELYMETVLLLDRIITERRTRNEQTQEGKQ